MFARLPSLYALCWSYKSWAKALPHFCCTNMTGMALYSSYQSSAEWDRQRIDSHKAIRKSVKRTHSGPVHSYSFNEELLMDTLIKGHDAILNWTQLSKDVGLCTVKTGLWPKNGGQVRVKCICRKLFSFIITKYVQKIATHLFWLELLSNSNPAIIALSGIPIDSLLKIDQCKAMMVLWQLL